MKMDVYKYIGYYNHDRLHTTLEDMAPVDYEKCNLYLSPLKVLEIMLNIV